MNTLSPQHLAMLKASAISPEVIAARGYRTITDGTEMSALGFSPAQVKLPALILPLHGVDGSNGVYVARPDSPRVIQTDKRDDEGQRKNRVLKYEFPKHIKMILDCPPTVRHNIGNPAAPLWITEGQKKADALVSVGAPCAIALLGVWNWRGSNKQHGQTILPDWEHVALKGRIVYVVFDSDVAENPNVGDALKRLVNWLENKGAAVLTVFLPPASTGGKQGADDFLAAGGTLSQMMSLARPLMNSVKPQTEKFDFQNDVVFTGDHNARILAQHLQGKAFYADGLGWLWFDGKRYVPGYAQVMEFARRIFRDCQGESAREPDSARRLKLAKWYAQALDNYRLKAAIELCQTDARTRAEVSEFDADPLLFNCANGTLNLKTGELQPHSPADKITKLSPVTYKPKAMMFDWLEFLERVVPDIETRNFLQRAVGYTLTGLTTEHDLFWLYGTGRNGKSTFVEAIANVLGDYATGADFQTFTERRGESMGDMTGWAGARMIASAEYDKGRRMNESLLKNITGGDKFRVRLLYRDAFDVHPQFKLWASFNDKPIISGTDEGIWRRIRLIPFDVTIPEDEMDKGLGERLKKYADGILCWAVEGCMQWQANGLGMATAVQRATSAYRGESDIFSAWLDECCVIHPNAKQAAGELFASYKRWAGNNAERELTQTEFGKRLTQRGFESKRTSNLRQWVGVALAAHITSEYPISDG